MRSSQAKRLRVLGLVAGSMLVASIAGYFVLGSARPGASSARDCLARPENAYGSWQPSEAELVAAAKLATLTCGDPDPVGKLQVCAKRAESRLVEVSATIPASECSAEPRSCTLATRSASARGRKWLVFRSTGFGFFVDEAGCGSFSVVDVSVVEMTSKPVVYFERSYRPGYGERLDCARDMPTDWSSLPAELRGFLCGDVR